MYTCFRSEGKQCAICMEIVTEKLAMSERRFAILRKWKPHLCHFCVHFMTFYIHAAACEHCFCLTCIRKWRGSTHTKKKTIRCTTIFTNEENFCFKLCVCVTCYHRACPLCRKVSYFIIPVSWTSLPGTLGIASKSWLKSVSSFQEQFCTLPHVLIAGVHV